MLNDVIFNNDKSALDDWNIVLTSKEIPLPSIKTSTVDIMGADGVLDLSEVLTGDVKYGNRELKLTFEVINNTDFNEVMYDVSNYLHGKRVTVRFSDDDSYYYVGRASINSWECVRRKGKVVVTVDCEPYKYAIRETVVNVVLENEEKIIDLYNKRKVVCPLIDVTGNISLFVDDVEYKLNKGEQQLINFSLFEGYNSVKVKGTGTIKITYRMGCL